MPIYGYRCRSCGHELEVLQKISDPPLKTCPKCGGELTKILYPVGVIYKGSGYYTTDYKGGKSASRAGSNGAKSDSESSGGDGKPADAAGESKSESKPESKASDSSSTE